MPCQKLVALSTDLPDEAAALWRWDSCLPRPVTTSTPSTNFSGPSAWRRTAAPRSRAPARRRSRSVTISWLGRIWRNAPDDMDRVTETRELVDLVLSSDPLAARIGSSERRRRLVDNFSYAEQRLSSCVEQRTGGQPSTDRTGASG